METQMTTHFRDTSGFPFLVGSSTLGPIWMHRCLSDPECLEWPVLSISLGATWKSSPDLRDSPFLNHLPLFVSSCPFLTKAEKIPDIHVVWFRVKGLMRLKFSTMGGHAESLFSDILPKNKTKQKPIAHSTRLMVSSIVLALWLQS